MIRTRALVSTGLLLWCLTIVPIVAAQPSVVGSWELKGSWPFAASHAALLPDGRVLLWSDLGAAPQIWDPVADSFTSANHPGAPFAGARPVQLASGDIGLIGGRDALDAGTDSTFSFSPSGLTWTALEVMNQERNRPGATLMSDSRIFVVGGERLPGWGADLPEDALPGDPWNLVLQAALTMPLNPWTFTLPDGLVMVLGPDASTRTLDENAQLWSVIAGMAQGSRLDGSAVLLPGASDRFMVAGGRDPATNSCEILDLTLGGGWQSTGAMQFARRHHNLTLLADGTVIATGGTLLGDAAAHTVLQAEIYDPATTQWTTMESMSTSRRAHSVALLLPDARVLVAGGGDGSAGSELHADANIYSPPYLFQGPRPVITAAPDSIRYKSVFTITTPEAGDIQDVWFVRAGAASGGFNGDQRALPLSYSIVPGELTVTAPDTAAVAPPGTYMLFVVDDAGVPSEAAMIRMSDGPPVIPLPNITTSAPTTGVVGQTYIYPAQASGGTPITWSLTQAPGWMAVNPVSGIVTAVPTQDGTFDVTVRATNVEGFDEQSWQVSIDPSFEQAVTVVPLGATWKYFKGDSDPGVDWAQPSYNDSGWLEGISGFGMGDGDDATELEDMEDNYSTVFTRTTFPLSAASTVTQVSVLYDYDDGFAVYLNGTLISQQNAPDPITFESEATSSHEATGNWERDDLTDPGTLGLLVDGINVLAAVGINRSIGSGDLTLKIELELSGGSATAVDAGDFTLRIPVQVRPNPFQGATKVSFNLQRGGTTRLEVYDVTGRRVHVQQRHLAAGAHWFGWDGRDERGMPTAAGIYPYRLVGPGVDVVGKMTRLSPVSR